MWRNYLTVGVRALVKNRTYAVITVAGLAIGMAACLMILLFVRYETSYDKWIAKAENVYQLQSWFEFKDSGETRYLQSAPYPAGNALAKDFPQVEREVFAYPAEPVMIKDGQATLAEDFLYVDEDFLDIVALPLAAGDPEALDTVDNALITQSEARKRFGTEDVIGKTMTMISKGVTYRYRIAGVLKDLPRNSHMKITMLVRFDPRAYFGTDQKLLDCWGCQAGFVYLALKPGSDPRAIEAALPAWEKRVIPDETSADARFNPGDEQDFRLVNVRDVHLGQAQSDGMTPGNDRQTIMTFGIIAMLILTMAVINFTNLATARASQRAREVALRKVLGAGRRQLIVQFIGESLLVALFAMLIALALVELLMPGYAAFLDADLKLTYFGADGVVLPVILLVLLVGVLGGLYPAFFMSRFQPAAVLKANQSAAETPGSGRLRSILVIGQFAISIGLIICTIIVYGQTVYARTVDPGYQRENILQVEGLNRAQLWDDGDTTLERMRRIPGVEAVGRTGIGVASDNSSNAGVMVPGRTRPILIGSYFADEGLKEAMGLKLAAGRWFDERPMDQIYLPHPRAPAEQQALVARGANVVINELAAKRLGYKSPQDAVGKRIRVGLVHNEFGLVPTTIVGVVQDSRFRSVRLPIDPILFANVSGGHQYLVIRYRGDPESVRAGVERAWKSVTDEVPFEAKLSEEIVRELYEADDARAQTFAAFSVLAVAVACLGLFGLAAFTAERRTKEIGIRKVLGARTRDVVRLLAWQFSKPVIVANLIAWPIAWWVMRDWLNEFDARIALGPWPFAIAAAAALVIAIGTIAGHAFKVARANPIHALRYE
jgi:putative ABC transport system permease protein